jgi:hypothetical protein
VTPLLSLVNTLHELFLSLVLSILNHLCLKIPENSVKVKHIFFITEHSEAKFSSRTSSGDLLYYVGNWKRYSPHPKLREHLLNTREEKHIYVYDQREVCNLA